MAEATATRLVVVISGRCPNWANRRGSHWGPTYRAKEARKQLVWGMTRLAMGRRPRASGPCSATATLRICGTLRDWDNAVASLKVDCDALRLAGAIFQDTPAMLRLTVRQEACPHRVDEAVVWEVTADG